MSGESNFKSGESRRRFLARSVSGAMALSASRAFAAPRASTSPNEKVSLAFIGINGMGGHHLGRILKNDEGLLDMVDVVTLCDVDENVLAREAPKVKEATGKTPRLDTDFRHVLEDDSVDACLIATPHHTHCVIGLPALLAGKDIYIEKPMNHVFREGQLMVEAARRHNRIVQHGSQMRSSEITAKAGEVLASGVIGEVKMTKAWNMQRAVVNMPRPNEPVPQGVNYDMWLGPASQRAFNPNRFHKTWRWYREYGNGDLGDDGAHDLDMARWALGVDTHPSRITAHGSRVDLGGEREYPDNMMIAYQYANGKVLLYEERTWTPYRMNGIDNGNAFYGTEGYMLFTRRGYFQVFFGNDDEKGPGSGSKRGRVGTPVPRHLANFVESVRTRKPTVAPAKVAHLSTALIHLGEIAYRTGNILDFDPESERFTNNDDANGLLTKEYRHPWTLPDQI